MRILLITYYFPPSDYGATNRILRLIPYWAENDFQCTVLTTDRENSRSVTDLSLLEELKFFEGIERTFSIEPFRKWDELRSKGSSNNRTGTRNGYLTRTNLISILIWILKPFTLFIRNFTSIPDVAVGWYPFAFTRGKHLLKNGNYDLIISTIPSQTANLVGYRLSKLFKIPFVADFRDSWLDYGRKYDKISKVISLNMLQKVIDQCSAATFTSYEMHKEFKSLFPKYGSKMFYLPHGIVDLQMEQISKDEGSIFSIGYIGTLDRLRDPTPLVKMVEHLKRTRPDIYNKLKIKIVGHVTIEIKNIILISDVKEKFEFVGFVNRMESIKLMYSCNALLLLLSDISNIGYGASSSKIYDYLATGFPILALVPEGSVSRMVKETRSGKAFVPTDHIAAAEWLSSLIDKKIEVIYKNETIKNLETNNIANKFWDIFERILQSPAKS